MATTAPLSLSQRHSRRLRGQKPLSPSRRQVEEEWSGASPTPPLGAPPSLSFYNARAYSASMTPSVSSLHCFSLLLNYRETSIALFIGSVTNLLSCLDGAQQGAQCHSANTPWLLAPFYQLPWASPLQNLSLLSKHPI